MKFTVKLEFHVDDVGLSKVTYTIAAISFESVFKAIMTLKENDYPTYRLKNVFVYLED